jgi:hypothetical protein
MELIKSNSLSDIVHETEVITTETKPFIEANTIAVSLEHLKQDCIIPVFSKDNESTISHYQFINQTINSVKEMFPDLYISEPDIRVSHVIKGRIPSAIGKPAKELLPFEKTIYYERCAFILNLPDVKININGNLINLSIGGVRAYNQENLYSKKSPEKFKVFIGFKNKVCTNLCISTDGFSDELRVFNTSDYSVGLKNVIGNYNKDEHISNMEQMSNFSISESQFAHFIGKLKMYQHLNKEEQYKVFPVKLNDSQISSIIRDYYNCPNFSRNSDGSINLWKLYNLFTEANKSSYIDSNFNRNVSAYELSNNLVKSLKNGSPNWLLN